MKNARIWGKINFKVSLLVKKISNLMYNDVGGGPWIWKRDVSVKQYWFWPEKSVAYKKGVYSVCVCVCVCVCMCVCVIKALSLVTSRHCQICFIYRSIYFVISRSESSSKLELGIQRSSTNSCFFENFLEDTRN